MTRAMSKKSPSPPVNQTGRVVTLAFAALVVIGIIALVVLSFTRQNEPVAANASPSPQASASPMPRPAATPGIHYKSQGHPGHDKKDPSETLGFVYNSDPPTSGIHFERFSETLISDKPLPKWLQVHLLEHGNVLLQYNCKCPDSAGALAQIASIYNNRQLPPGQTAFDMQTVQGIEERGTGVIVAPNPQMKQKIALTAWTRMQTFDAIDQPKMMTFINAYLTNAENASQ
jgi:hypothetical protein